MAVVMMAGIEKVRLTMIEPRAKGARGSIMGKRYIPF